MELVCTVVGCLTLLFVLSIGILRAIIHFRVSWISRNELILSQFVRRLISDLDMWCRQDIKELEIICKFLREAIENESYNIDLFRDELRKWIQENLIINNKGLTNE